VSFWWHVLEFIIRVALGVVLVVLSITVVVELLKTSIVQIGLVLLGLLLMGLWAMWAMLPEWFRKFIHRVFEKRKERNHGR
jgi:hypothetical protein